MSSAALAQEPDPRLERWLEAAEAAAARGREARAVALWWRATDRAPTDPRAPLALAARRLGGPIPASPTPGHAEEARRIAAALGGAEPGDGEPSVAARLVRARARALGHAGDRGAALDLLERLGARVDPAVAGALRDLAAAAAGAGELLQADRALELARRADATDRTLLQDLAAVRLARGQAASAVQLLRDVLRRSPPGALVEAQRELAGALLAAGRGREALVTLGRVLGSCPDSARCHLDLARAALMASHPRCAAHAAGEAARRAPEDAEAHLVLGLAEVARGRLEAGATALREAARLAPDDPRVRQALEALQSDGARPGGDV